jgi:hypothetical protein
LITREKERVAAIRETSKRTAESGAEGEYVWIDEEGYGQQRCIQEDAG